MRWVGGLVGCVIAQTLLVGRSMGAGGQVVGADTVLPAGPLVVRFSLPAGWQRDTFLLVVRNALGVVARVRLLPQSAPAGQAFGRLHVPKPGFYLLTVHHPRTGARVWASRRLYVVAPPYTTVAQVRAYHNALLSRATPSPQIRDKEILSEGEVEAITQPLPDAAPVTIQLSDEDLALPEGEGLSLPEESEAVEEDWGGLDD